MSIGQPFPRSDPGDSNHRTRRSAELRETVEVLDLSMADIARGRHGEQTLGISVMESQSVVGEFPKAGPLSPLVGAQNVAGSMAKLSDHVGESEPRVLIDQSTGEAHRVHGSFMPHTSQEWTVFHRGGDNWRVFGGDWSYYPNGQFDLMGDPLPFVTFRLPQKDFKLRSGWVSLKAFGSMFLPDALLSPFIIGSLGWAIGEPLTTDYDLVVDEFTFSHSATYGYFPVAYVAAPGVKTVEPLIISRRLYYLPPGPYMSICEPLNAFSNFS